MNDMKFQLDNSPNYFHNFMTRRQTNQNKRVLTEMSIEETKAKPRVTKSSCETRNLRTFNNSHDRRENKKEDLLDQIQSNNFKMTSTNWNSQVEN